MILYVIGNGFDLAHNYKTSYNDFKCYLEDNRNQLPEIFLDRYDLISFIDSIPCIGEDWNNFEDALAKIKLSQISKLFNSYRNKLNDKSLAGLFEEIRNDIESVFISWVNSIKVSGKPMYKLETEGNMFLTFNYTDTLEKIYKIKTKCICHIHGDIYENKTTGEVLLFGHGVSSEEIRRNHNIFISSDNCDFVLELERLKKDYSNIIQKNAYKKIKEYGHIIEKVIIICHGLGVSDLYYLNDIANVTQKASWIYYGYQLADRKDAYLHKIKSLNHDVQLHDQSELLISRTL